uniref:Uncharacterized protein n=1 Tax=Helianthus annuus TaxID=4232 RepID=A0A251TFI7_HELAN
MEWMNIVYVLYHIHTKIILIHHLICYHYFSTFQTQRNPPTSLPFTAHSTHIHTLIFFT